VLLLVAAMVVLAGGYGLVSAIQQVRNTAGQMADL
jgi:hypothetical protein